MLTYKADLLEERIPEYGSFMRTEMGADIGTSDYFVLPLAVSMMRDVAGRISTIVGSVNTTQDEGTSAMVWKEPYGVTLGIAPWLVSRPSMIIRFDPILGMLPMFLAFVL